MFVVMRLEDFHFESIHFPTIPISIEKGQVIGFLPVYETLEDAMQEYPDSECTEIKFKDVELKI